MNRYSKLACLVAMLLAGCGTSKTAFNVAFGRERPPEIVMLNEKLTTSADSNQVLLYGKYSGSKEAFHALVVDLNLKRVDSGKGLVVPPTALSLEWWTPPSFEEQLSIDERYYYFDRGVENERPTQEVVTLYTNGVIYLFKNGYPGK